MRIVVSLLAAAAAVFVFVASGVRAQTPMPAAFRVELLPAPFMRLPGEVDSNSPLVWDRVGGWDFLFAVTSSAGRPRVAAADLRFGVFSAAQDVAILPWPGGGIWMEAVVGDVDGTWYGYYHNENVAAEECGATTKVIPRIGAARSRDYGRSWEPLGIVLAAPPNTHRCATTNHYFVGGVGDFSVQLDAESRDLYFFYSQYVRASWLQGVAVARLAWADRDDPQGKIMVWSGRRWLPASPMLRDEGEWDWRYPAALPVFPALDSWHGTDTAVDAFWGPSVHWNTHLQHYVMLLNRAKDAMWTQEGIYVSYAPHLADPRLWTPPVKILNGGGWYPQVVGLEARTGTDKTAGEIARLFVSGTSTRFIRFVR